MSRQVATAEAFFLHQCFLVLIAAWRSCRLERLDKLFLERAGGDPHFAMINEYCLDCHNQPMKTGGLAFDTLDIKHPEANAEIWEKVAQIARAVDAASR